MFEHLGGYDEAYSRDGSQPAPPLRLRKTWSQRLGHWAINAAVMPVVAVVYFMVSAEGLRSMMSVFATRLYKIPVPGFASLRNYQGWDDLDIATLAALLLFVTVTLLWRRVFIELMGGGTFRAKLAGNPPLFWLLMSVVAIILVGDCVVFYLGLQTRASSSWTETPGYVPALATTLYMAGLALIGAWHADYHCSETA